MAIEITSNKLSFDGVEFKQGDVTASKDFEQKRKSDEGIPLKRLRAFESASTFIDFNRSSATRQKDRFGNDLKKGETLDVFVRDSFEAFHIDPFLVSLGPKSNTPLQLTGSIKTLTLGEEAPSAMLAGRSGFDTGSYAIILDNGLIASGTLTVDNALSIAPGTGLMYGALGVLGGAGNLAETDQNIIIQSNTTTTINVSEDNPSYTIAAGTEYTINNNADVTIVHSNQTFTGGTVGVTNVEINQEEVVVGPDTTVGTGGVAFTQVISTNTTAGAGATTLNVTNENISITINKGINYTVPIGSNVTIINTDQQFTGGTVTDISVTGNTSLTDITATGNASLSGITASLDFSQLSMDITQNGLFTLGSTGQLEFSGGNTNFNTNVNVDVTDASSSVEITGSAGSVTLEVSGGNTVINGVTASLDFSQLSMDITQGGLFALGGSTIFEVSGGNTVINSEFTQSGASVFTDGANVFEGDTSLDPLTSTGSITTFVGDLSSSEAASATVEISGPSGSGELVVDQISVGWDNDIPVTASLTLSNAAHGMGRQVFVCSGSDPLYGIGFYTQLQPSHHWYGLPASTGQHLANPAGVIRLELPSASVGMSFDIKNKQRTAQADHTTYAPTILVTPNNSEKFIFNVVGADGTAGKGIQILSQSMQQNARLHVTCQSEASWSIINMNGPWTDEP